MSYQIDRKSDVPYYSQLKRILLDKIERAEWKAGDLIPSEQELQETYGLSRTTVRQALYDLVVEGRLIRERGRGTFIAPPSTRAATDPHQGLSRALSRQGIRPGWHLISTRWVIPPVDVARELRVPRSQTVLRIRRLRLADDQRIGYHSAFVPPPIAAMVDHSALVSGQSLGYLASLPQLRHSRADRIIEASAAHRGDAWLLAATPGTPILQIERLVVAEDGTPLEFLRARYLGSRFRYRVSSAD
ncbi:MAG: GntR family transcriptional regulator [Roseiflexaceae bacterium]